MKGLDGGHCTWRGKEKPSLSQQKKIDLVVGAEKERDPNAERGQQKRKEFHDRI